jgi:hypothetical protein
VIVVTWKSFYGKDRVCEELLNSKNLSEDYHRVLIADSMKNIFLETTGINMFGRAIKEKNREKLMEFTSQYPLMHWIKATQYTECCVVTDVHTLEEINYLKSKFKHVLTIRLVVDPAERIK